MSLNPRAWWRAVAGIAAFLPCSLAPLPAAGAEVLYGVTFGDELISIDTTTGAGTLIGPLSTSMAAFGLGSRGGNLYTFDQVADVIRQLNPATGATVATIDIGIGGVVGEGALTFRSDGVGFLSSSAGAVGRLFSFDIVGGTSTPITPADGLDPSMDGLDFSPGGVLFGLSQGASILYTINQTTGATTEIGDTGFDDATSPVVSGLAFRGDGILFGEIDGSLYTINPATGAATLIGPIGFNVSGLTFLQTQAVPEPSSLLLLGCGLFALAAAGRRRRRAA